jgi:hypothetical protein
MSDANISALITSMSAFTLDRNCLINELCQRLASIPISPLDALSTRLSQTSISSEPPVQSARVAHYYHLNLLEIPSYSTPLSAAELSNPCIQAILIQYHAWFVAEDDDLLDEPCPKDPFVMDIVSRAMVMVIMRRAWDRDARMPPVSPVGHPCAPFWSRPDGQEVGCEGLGLGSGG